MEEEPPSSPSSSSSCGQRDAWSEAQSTQESEGDDEDFALRRKAREALLLSQARDEDRILREKAREALLKASESGSLFFSAMHSLGDHTGDSILGVSASPEELHRLARAQDLLLHASLDGRLGHALREARSDVRREAAAAAAVFSAEEELVPSPPPFGQRPVDFANDFFADSIEETPSEADQAAVVRAQARDVLFQASIDGRLDNASRPADDGESLGSEMMSLLGDDDEFLGSDDDFHLRAQARETLLQASLNGELDESLQAVILRHTGFDNERLRSQARDTMVQASSTGGLADALAGLHGGLSFSAVAQGGVASEMAALVIEALRSREAAVAAAEARTKSLVEQARERARGLHSSDQRLASAVCTICQDTLMQPAWAQELLSEDIHYCMLPCSHCFHIACAEHWLRSSSTCPNCRLSADESDYTA